MDRVWRTLAPAPLCLVLVVLVGLATDVPQAPGTAHADAAAIYYVAPGGSDSASGLAPTAALRTIQRAVDLALPGDTVELASGVYIQDVFSRRGGSADARITITGPSDAVIKGAGQDRVVQIAHSYITLSGFTIDGLYAPGAARPYRDTLIYVLSRQADVGVAGLRVRGLTLRNAGGECVRLRYLVREAELSDNRIGPCGQYDFPNGVWRGGSKNGEGIYIGTAPEQLADGKNPTATPDVSRDNWIHHNTFDTQGNECVDIKEAATNNLVEYNRCTGQKDTESGGFDSRGNGNIFRNNEVWGNLGAGVRLGGDTPSDGIDNVVALNTIRDNGRGGMRVQAAPQRLICGNTMSNNTTGDAAGTYGKQFNPTAPCPATPTPATDTPTQSPTDTATATLTVTADGSATPEGNSLPTPTDTATATSEPTATASPTQSPSATHTATATPVTLTSTRTPTRTATGTATRTPTRTATSTRTVKPTRTPKPTKTATRTRTPSPTR